MTEYFCLTTCVCWAGLVSDLFAYSRYKVSIARNVHSLTADWLNEEWIAHSSLTHDSSRTLLVAAI